MDEYEPLYSEEDVRTKVVTAWLADHSFGPSDISVEYSFEIRLGRKILPIGSEKCDRALSQVFRSRAGILVRSCDGRNLLIVEVKAPDEPLDENAREQGICYAHLLRKGGIAPFVVLTNGRETKIYNGISEELINDGTIPLSHPRVKAGFRVSADDSALRAEALQGELEALARDSEQLCNEYTRMYELCIATRSLYSSKKCGGDLLNILRSLQPGQDVLEGRGLPTIEEIKAKSSNLAAFRYQLPWPFDKLDISVGRN